MSQQANNTSTKERANRSPVGRVLLLGFIFVLACAALLPATALARTTRAYEGSFEVESPQKLTVDQSNGDVYVVSGLKAVKRFDSTGTPKNFTEGPGAGTNEIKIDRPHGVAIDNSGGPFNGDIYIVENGPISNSPHIVRVFASSGAPLGEITGVVASDGKFSDLVGISVDQADGSLYVSEPLAEKVWRYAPASPVGAVDDADYTVSGIKGETHQSDDIAAVDGDIYVPKPEAGDLRKYSASSFAPDVPTVKGTVVGGNRVLGVGVDPKNGDVYADEGNQVTVFDANGAFLYRFGFSAYLGGESSAVAVKSAASGPAEKAYAIDTKAGTVSTFGPVTKLSTLTRPELSSFGADGTTSTSFGSLRGLAFDQNLRKLYALQENPPGIYGFDASSPPDYSPLPPFGPLPVAAASELPGIGVDNTGLSTAGRLYYVTGQFKSSADFLYGFDPTGAPLSSPFPVDPAVSPGAPAGSPKQLCGTAVDSAGNIWVSNRATSRVLEYSSNGVSLPGTFSTEAQENSASPCQLAFDSDDNLYVAFPGTSVWKYSAASGYASAVKVSRHWPQAIAVDPSTDDLYVVSFDDGVPSWLDEFDPSGALLNERSLGADINSTTVDANNHDVYLGENGAGKQIRVFGPGVLLPETLTKLASGISNSAATLNGTVVTQGVTLSDCHFEYVTKHAFELSGFSDLSSGGSADCSPVAGLIPLDLEEHSVSATIGGLNENASYRFRLSATNANGATASSDTPLIATGRPEVETTGSPVRTATTARLDSRVNPENANATYHFEYGDQGPCDANPCTATVPQAAGSGSEVELVSQQIEGLTPNTTYHYRVIADNGNPAGAAFGKDMTVTTRVSDAPLSHGHFPGPVGSDRAWEQVSIPDSGGNPVTGAEGVSDDGTRAFFRIHGGTPISSTGTFLSPLFAERTPSGWHSKSIHPLREQLVGTNWIMPRGRSDLSDQIALNLGAHLALWRLRPGQPASKVFEENANDFVSPVLISADASRALALIKGTHDPAHPVVGTAFNLYDVSTGTPKLIGLMPDGSVPVCGVPHGNGKNLPEMEVNSASNWVSPDGSHAFFPSSCSQETQLYMRDFGTEETKPISDSPVSGPTCAAAFIKSTPEAAFLWTKSRLSADDSDPANCAEKNPEDGDVYRYDIANGALKCVTCVAGGLDADVVGSIAGPWSQIAVAADGSRVYFTSPNTLLPGAAPGVYRVMVASGDLAYVGSGFEVGDSKVLGEAITPDGSAIGFVSSNSTLNAVGGQQNGGTQQYYRYNDNDRSLICVSCPQDGSVPLGGVKRPLVNPTEEGSGPNMTALSGDGKTFAFATVTPLANADQNTPRAGQDPEGGTDVYEWRDGRQLLVTDGLTNWPKFSPPDVSAITPSGHDLFFTAATQYTPDALDGYKRLYDARIGGGIEFPPPPKPCPLEVCQGTPKGAPEEAAPGTGAFNGPGNAKQKAQAKKKKAHKKRHHKKARHQRANHKRRTAR